MFKIKLDKETIIEIVNIYFSIIIWVCLFALIVQLSNEFCLICFLVLSLIYFLLPIINVLWKCKILKIENLKMKKKEKEKILSKYKKKYHYFDILNTIYSISFISITFLFIFLSIHLVSIILVIILIILLCLFYSFNAIFKIA